MEFELPKINVSFEYDKEKDEIVFVINGVEKRVKTKDMITGMVKLQEQNTALEQQPCDCISREFIEIVVDYPPADLCTYPEYKGKPYFSIKYRENGKTYVGFGTYKIEMLSQWIKKYFISDDQPKTGHWIEEEKGLHITVYKCSECGRTVMDDSGYDVNVDYPYCHCGAKMVVLPESEK